MMGGPPLEAGEEVRFDHVPSQSAFRRTALVLLGATLIPTVVIAVLMPDTAWPALPLFVTCVLLMQERVTLGRHRAWVTNRRIIRQGDEDLPLYDVAAAEPERATGAVRLRIAGRRRAVRLAYPADAPALANAILTARKGDDD